MEGLGQKTTRPGVGINKPNIASKTRPSTIDARAKAFNQALRGRTTWLNKTYQSTIRLIGINQWEERFNKDGKISLRYQTVNVTNQYVELYTKDRDQTMRLYADRMEFIKDGKWVRLSVGTWVNQAQ